MSCSLHFSSRSRLQAMLDVEAALADAEASVGVIPADAAAAIRAAARGELFDAAALESEAERAGNLAIPLVRALTSRVASSNAVAARYVHWGATSQDIIDTALVLQLRAAVPPVVADLSRGADRAADHARTHVNTTMAGRTWLQQATPVTFGLKAAGWCEALDRAVARVDGRLHEALVLQFGGASGTLAAFGDRGPAVAAALGTQLGLAVPSLPWHTHRDRLAALACALGVATGTVGKIGRDLGLLAQTEVAEAHDPPEHTGGSSTMPHKRNPVYSARAVAAAVRAPGLVATVLTAMLQEHERALGGWQAEWDTIPQLVTAAADGAQALAASLATLIVDPERMRANAEMPGGLTLAESIAMRLVPHLGKPEAHAALDRAAHRAVEEGGSFADLLADDPKISAILNRDEITKALSPEAYLGSAEWFVARVLRQRETRTIGGKA